MPTRPSESAEHSFPSNSPTTSFSSASRIITDDTRRAVADLSDEQSVEGGSIREPDDPEVLIAQLLLEENESSSLGVECTFSEGDTLIQEGERRDTCLLLLDGEVKVKKMIYHPDRGTHSIMIRTLYAPCLIGEIALMTDGFATASVIANEHCTAVSIDQMTLGALSANNPSLDQYLEQMKAERMNQTARFVRNAEDRLTRAHKKQERDKMREIFSLKSMEQMDYADTYIDIGSFSLTGMNKIGERRKAEFVVSATRAKRVKHVTKATEVPRRFTGNLMFLPQRFRVKTIPTVTTEPIDGDVYSFSISLQEPGKPVSTITTFELDTEKKEVDIILTNSEYGGIADYGFISQIYREAFREADTITTKIAEDQTKTFLRDRRARFLTIPESDAPSLFHALSPIAAARGLFLTIPRRTPETNGNYKAISYRIDNTLSDIMTALRHIERTCIDNEDEDFAAASLSREKFHVLYHQEPYYVLDWADKKFEKYLSSEAYTSLITKYPQLKKPLDIQGKRIQALYRDERMEMPDSINLY